MAEEERYNVGIVESDERPTIDEVAESITGDFVDREVEVLDDGRELEYQHRGYGVYVEESDEESEFDYVHFNYVTDRRESYRVRTEEGEEDDRNERRLVEARVLYFRNGQFAIQSRTNIENYWILNFIMDITDANVERQDWRLYNFGSEFMKQLYDEHSIVSVLKMEEPSDPSEVSSEVEEFIVNLAGEVENFQFSTGHGNGNLKSREAIDKCAQHLDILRIHMKEEDGYTESASSRGTLVTKWDIGEIVSEATDARQRQESRAIRRRLQPRLESLKEIY